MVVSVKRMSLAAFLCAVCILCFSACSGRDEDVRQADSIRIAPYVYSEEESRLLDMLRMKNDVGIVEVQAPSSVKWWCRPILWIRKTLSGSLNGKGLWGLTQIILC